MQHDLLVSKVIKGNKKAQKAFYEMYAPKMYGVALRFANHTDDANDIMQEGFIKVFNNLESFRNEGSIEGWIRKTIINTAINLYKKNAKYRFQTDIEKIIPSEENKIVSVLDQISAEELTDKISKLPYGYRTVFNLNVIEGYTHKEIGELLSISENTSKSQLARAKAHLKKRIINR
jgi:RNA polymerase sigma factor (sigma-70 family)